MLVRRAEYRDLHPASQLIPTSVKLKLLERMRQALVKIGMASEQSTPSLANLSTHLTASTGDKINKSSIRKNTLKRGRNENLIDNPSVISNATCKSFTSLNSPRYLRSFSREFSPVTLTASTLTSQNRQEETNRNYIPQNEGICRQEIFPVLIPSADYASIKSRDALNATLHSVEGMRADQNLTNDSDTRQFEVVPGISPSTSKINADFANKASSTISKPANVPIKSQELKTNLLEVEIPKRSSEEPLSIPHPRSPKANLFNNIQIGGMEQLTGLPGPGQRMREQSSQKKHKCPYCDTEFTRHHNLKSHLLTHSQEKPFTCQTCAMRFRRLHDLKRHMKLHTGERPHICPKCDRKFARGDALARHTKGQGGCAGRRSSFSSVGADDDFDGSNVVDSNEITMDGVKYDDSTSRHNENEVSRDEGRQFNIPSLTKKNLKTSESRKAYDSLRTSNSYLQDESRKALSASVTHSSRENQESSGSRIAPHIKDAPKRICKQGLCSSNFPSPNTAGNIVIPQSLLTEGLKPSSPANITSFQSDQEASLSDQEKTLSTTPPFLSNHFDKQQTNQTSLLGNSQVYSHKNSHGLKLPALVALTPPDQRYNLSSQAPASNNNVSAKKTNVIPPNSVILPGAQNLTSHQFPGQADIKFQNFFAAGEIGVWSYIQTLEDKVKQLNDRILQMEKAEKNHQEKISRLTIEVTSLKSLHKDSNIPPALTESDLSK
ncbi:zinc finger protein [Golovinomyces cichoracearum]|uniref:Zinc finger protein n=1 Tax=Golovinomyces cichoracearum TaxID=62708 RepID=A0A420INP4_9PEZI|nr:zinc finger protein [Golovinomyces cichoracearum]